MPSQVYVQVDDVSLCGGLSQLRGHDGAGRSLMRCLQLDIGHICNDTSQANLATAQTQPMLPDSLRLCSVARSLAAVLLFKTFSTTAIWQCA